MVLRNLDPGALSVLIATPKSPHPDLEAQDPDDQVGARREIGQGGDTRTGSDDLGGHDGVGRGDPEIPGPQPPPGELQ